MSGLFLLASYKHQRFFSIAVASHLLLSLFTSAILPDGSITTEAISEMGLSTVKS